MVSQTAQPYIWGIHTQDDNLFLNKNKLALGWKELGDLSRLGSDKELWKKEYAKAFPGASKMTIATCVGMLIKFATVMKIGDYVVFPSKFDRMVHIGIVNGDYKFESLEPEYAQQHSVKWLKHLPRTDFSQGALYEMGTFMSLFQIKNNAEEILMAIKGKKNTSQKESEDVTIAATAEAILDNTRDYILKQLSKELKGFSFEGFVADLLNAMGYRTKVLGQSGDHGIDIVAYKDELPPRILVQVKSIVSDIPETIIQSLKGAMREGDYGLFVTLSHYTKNAQKYLESTPIIRGIDGYDLADLILKHYEDLSEEYKKIIPLKKVYIPVAGE